MEVGLEKLTGDPSLWTSGPESRRRFLLSIGPSKVDIVVAEREAGEQAAGFDDEKRGGAGSFK
jgi:hypothetical protein